MNVCTFELDMTCHNWGSPADGASTKCCPEGASCSNLAPAPGLDPPTETTRTVDAIGGWSLKITHFLFKCRVSLATCLNDILHTGKYHEKTWSSYRFIKKSLWKHVKFPIHTYLANMADFGLSLFLRESFPKKLSGIKCSLMYTLWNILFKINIPVIPKVLFKWI